MANQHEVAQAYTERDARVSKFLRENLPVKHIASLEGMDYDNCRLYCNRLAADQGIDYKPNTSETAPVFAPGLNPTNRQFRAGIADVLYQLRHPNTRDRTSDVELGRLTGIPPRAQSRAIQRPFNHDWTLSQMTRLAESSELDFTKMMLRCLLTPEQYQSAIRAAAL